METPRVSVVIPMYNSQHEIVRCLNSVAKQRVSVYQVIVVNDGSKDGSEQQVKQWMSAHPTVPVSLINQENGGVSKARNTGLRAATGDWIALLDSDDEWHEDKLEKQFATLSQYPQIDFVACNPIHDKINRFVWKRLEHINFIKVSDLIYKNYFQPSTVLFKSSIINDIGYFDEQQRYAEEGNYFMRIANKYTCVLVNERLINYGYDKAGFGESGLSGNVVEMEKGELKNLSYALRHRFINLFQYITALVFSILKFSIRWVRVKWMK